jgi:hypothetical protein
MNIAKVLSCSLVLMLLGGCASSHVQKGALIGALSGAALGTGLGYAVSNEDLLGSDVGGPGADTALPRGGSIASGLAIGVMVGAIVGAMVGHGRDDGFEERPKPPELEASRAQQQQARAPHLRDL